MDSLAFRMWCRAITFGPPICLFIIAISESNTADGQKASHMFLPSLGWMVACLYVKHRFDERRVAAKAPATQAIPNTRSFNGDLASLTDNAEQGDAAAQFNLGRLYMTGTEVPKDTQRAVIWYRKAADQGHAKAQAEMGTLYEIGYGVPEDIQQAISWYQKAADQGYAPAQSDLGLLYAKGFKVPRDIQQAVSLYRKAAEQRYRPAQYGLGLLYRGGNGLPTDMVMAYMWFNIASQEDELGIATQERNELEKTLPRNQIAEGQRLAREWLAEHPKK